MQNLFLKITSFFLVMFLINQKCNAQANIQKLEYFFNSNIAFGSGTIIDLPSPTPNLTGYTFTPNTSALSNGLNTLNVRIWDGTNWSNTTQKVFYKENIITISAVDIISAEYFFDTDPGFGNATAATLTSGQSVTFNITGDISALTSGLHRLYVRTKDANGNWSKSVPKLFYKENIASATAVDITNAEYFFDTDPGFGNATAATLTAGQSVTFNITGDISTLTSGLHRFYVRTKDANGNWGQSIPKIVYKENIASATAVDITSAEYFFDTDPGFGNAIAATLTAGQSVTFNITGDISTLTSGLHRLYVRTKDANGIWSQSIPKLFYKENIASTTAVDITSAEYFFDTDPGFGNATPATLTAGQSITFNITGDISSLTSGLHRLYVRTKDANGIWSQSIPKLFYKENIALATAVDITNAEYFFDTDPGFGNATAATLTAGQSVTFNITGDISLLTSGLHRLYVRSKDANGIWSQSIPKLFYKENIASASAVDITSAEYFFDTDPGFGNAIQASVTSGQSVVINISNDISTLNTGLHNFFIRTKDANNKWSLTNAKSFFYTQPIISPTSHIVNAEYFYTTDPGFGNGTPITVASPSNVVTLNFSPNINALPTGLFIFAVRVQDALGKWSLISKELLYKEPLVVNSTPQNITQAEYFFNADPGFGNANPISVSAAQSVVLNTNTNIASLNNGLNMFYIRSKNATGNWSVTASQLFYKEDINTIPTPSNIIAKEYFIDTDPGFGNATPIAVSTAAQSVNITNLSLPISLTTGLHNFYIRSKTSNGKWSLTTVQLFYYESIVNHPLPGAITKMEWFWDVDPGFGNANSVSVPINTGSITNFIFPVPVPNLNAAHNFYYRVEDDWSLTTVIPFNLSALPLTLVSFTAQALPNQNKVLTNWQTQSENNTKHFEVEHSFDGSRFEKFGQIAAAGNSTTTLNYSLLHNNPKIGSNFYRLKMVDNDGAFTYSPIVKIIFSNGQISIFPNPVVDALKIRVNNELLTQKVFAKIIDSKGAEVANTKLSQTETVMNVMQLTSGSYRIIILNSNGETLFTKQFLKQ